LGFHRFLDDHDANSRSFEWVADPDKIIAAGNEDAKC
jgi:hypothetical protein